MLTSRYKIWAADAQKEIGVSTTKAVEAVGDTSELKMPTERNTEFIGYLKYEGAQVVDGVIDARAAANALSGFDYALRPFINQENATVGAASLPIPVSTERGSWGAYIPQDIGAWITTVLGAGAVIYASTAAKKMAENDFKDVGLSSVFKRALTAILWCIRIGKHLGDFTRRSVKTVGWRNHNTEVGIENDEGEVLFVPSRYLEAYRKAPRNLLNQVASVVEPGRTLKVAKVEDGETEEAEILAHERHMFVTEEPPDGRVLFPKLVHGARVVLNGLVTKGNEKENSKGFEHQQHVLTCYPLEGSIERFKPHMFLPCRISGLIDRSDGHGGLEAARPKINFDHLHILLSDQPELFPEEGA